MMQNNIYPPRIKLTANSSPEFEKMWSHVISNKDSFGHIHIDIRYHSNISYLPHNNITYIGPLPFHVFLNMEKNNNLYSTNLDKHNDSIIIRSCYILIQGNYKALDISKLDILVHTAHISLIEIDTNSLTELAFILEHLAHCQCKTVRIFSKQEISNLVSLFPLEWELIDNYEYDGLFDACLTLYRT